MAPRVFISYTHDSPEHRDHVWQLSEGLRKNGLDCRVDLQQESSYGGLAAVVQKSNPGSKLRSSSRLYGNLSSSLRGQGRGRYGSRSRHWSVSAKSIGIYYLHITPLDTVICDTNAA